MFRIGAVTTFGEEGLSDHPRRMATPPPESWDRQLVDRVAEALIAHHRIHR